MPDQPRLFSPYDAPMWQSVADGAMKLQRCSGCGRFRYPPGACCPACLSTEASWESISGRGTLLSWATFHRQYLPAYPPPHICVAVRLDEGPILISCIDAADAGALALDAPVELVYGTHPDGYALPRVRLVKETKT